MSKNFGDKLVIAISSRALFDLDESHRVYEQEGLDAYSRYQVAHEDEVLAPGEAFPMVKKLLRINEKLDGDPRVEVILLSRNSADTGLRVFNSIEHYGLNISRAAFCGGESPYRYVSAFGCHLFLSTNAEDVCNALNNGIAAATLISSGSRDRNDDELRFAFDGDTPLPFQVHLVQELVGHVPGRHRPSYLEKPVGEGGLAVVYVSDDTEVADEARVHDSPIVAPR